jgi:radical SAM superfamily enzyme YgiQ (UPF0313 family)
LREFPVLAFSVAYELELAGFLQMLEGSGIAPQRSERRDFDPFVLAGGPLTFSNPMPLAPFADAIVVGEAEGTLEHVVDVLFGARDRESALLQLGQHPHVFVPALHSELPNVARADDVVLPARSAIRTPHTELSNMFLIEAERGCSRGCRYCVMRRSTNGGMRIVPIERILSLIPESARRVGLVGAAISDHPRIAQLVDTLADQGREVGLSSLRPDRLKDELALALRKAGHRTLTTALDGPSQRMRDSIERKAKEKHIERAAHLVREHGFDRLKLYMMIGLPDERDDDIDELIGFAVELSRIAPLSLGIAPFVSKRNTPLDGLPFAGIDVVERRLAQLRRGVRGRVDIRATSARWAWVEWVLAQGGQAEGRAVREAVHGGGRYRAWRKAFEGVQTERKARLSVVA